VTNGSNYVNCAADCTNGVSLTVDGTIATYIGYPAASGYDLASGLGTLNATNLINNWPNINSEIAPGSVALSVYSAVSGPPLLSGATITHGSTTYLGATVTAASGKPTPTGDVAVISSNIQASDKSVDRITLVSGTGEDTNGLQLPGGTYTLVAQYAGDTNYAPATSSPFTITVNAEASQVVIMDASAQPVTSTGYMTNQNLSLLTTPTVAYGTQVRITVEPFGLFGNSIGIPSGSITVLDKGTAIASIPLNSEGAATFASNSLAVGSHSLTFSYAGDASFSASTSLATTGGAAIYNNFTGADQTAVAFTVTTVATQTALSATSTDLGASGGTSTLTAVVSSTSPSNTGSAPTGQVEFKFVNSGGGVSTSFVTVTPAYDSNGNLVATASEVVSATGTYTAIFVATGNYTGSTGNSITLSDNFCDIICFTTNTTTKIAAAGGGTTFASDANLVFDIQVQATYYAGAIDTGITTDVVNGSVAVYANGVQIGQPVSLNSATGAATFTVPKTGNYLDLPSGGVTITAYYTGGTATATIPLIGPVTFDAEASTGSDAITVQGNSQGDPTSPNLSGDFTLQTLQTAQVMPAGTTGRLSFPLQLTATNGFAQNYSSSNIALTCASSTPGLTCTLSAASIGLSSGYGTSTATVSPSANYTVAQDASPALPTRWWISGGGVAMGCILLLGLPARRRACKAMLSVIALCFIAIGTNGCAGHANAGVNESAYSASTGGVTPTSGVPGKGGKKTDGGFTPDLLLILPAGTYPVTVTGTVTLNGVVVKHNTVFNVVVQ
jgi:hypothetical protein